MIITEKILINIPVLYDEIIYDNLSDACRSRNEFIIKAIEEKFEKDKINYKPNIICTPQTKEQMEDVEDFLKRDKKIRKMRKLKRRAGSEQISEAKLPVLF